MHAPVPTDAAAGRSPAAARAAGEDLVSKPENFQTHRGPIPSIHMIHVRSEDPKARMASWRLTIIDKISIIYYKVSFIEQLSQCTPNRKYLLKILQFKFSRTLVPYVKL